jgi:hypothetical protein
MKKLLFTIITVLGLVGFAQAQETDIDKLIEFKNDNYNFGKIEYNKAVSFEVQLKNIGKDSVKIERVQVGCGCTTPKYEVGPYAPGQTFKVELGFNGATKGVFEKNATIYFSNGLTKLIRFFGETFEVPANAAPAGAASKF